MIKVEICGKIKFAKQERLFDKNARTHRRPLACACFLLSLIDALFLFLLADLRKELESEGKGKMIDKADS